MKFALLICLALASSAYAADDALTQDLMDFVELLPQDQLLEVLLKYIEDPEFLEMIEYVMISDEFKELVLALEAIPEYVEFLVFLDESGLDIFGFLEILHESLGLPPPTFPEDVEKSKQLRGVMNDLTNDIRVILPKEAIKELHEEKRTSSAAFKFFAERISSTEAVNLVMKLYSNADFQDILATLLSNGVDVADAAELSSEIFGFTLSLRK